MTSVPRKVSWPRRAAPLVVACLLGFWLEHKALDFVVGDDPNSPLMRSVFGARALYSYAVSSWPRELVPRYTAIVHIDPEVDPTADGLANNVCLQRAYLAELLPAIAERAPAILVIDKYFTSSGCPQAEPTAALVAAMAAISAKLPVVVGLKATATADRHDSQLPSLLVPPLAFTDQPGLRQGLVNIDLMPQRIPLGWTVRNSAHPSDAKGEWRASLALTAALLHEPDLFAKAPRLQRLTSDREHPYLSMIPPERFSTLQASDVLCTVKPVSAAFERVCEGAKTPKIEPSYLRGRIVILGETGVALDRHDTGVIGNVPGTVLQANYVEALLDERYFLPAPEWVNYLVGLLMFVALEASLRHRQPLVALGLAVGVVAAAFLLLALTARHLGYFVGPAIGTLVLIFMLIAWLRELIIHKGGTST